MAYPKPRTAWGSKGLRTETKGIVNSLIENVKDYKKRKQENYSDKADFWIN
jgi:hypothetical protein